MAKIQAWSATGTCDGRTYQHIRVEPETELISSCNACGRASYVQAPKLGSVSSSGIRLVKVMLNPNGFQVTVTNLCRDCAVALANEMKAVALEMDG